MVDTCSCDIYFYFNDNYGVNDMDNVIFASYGNDSIALIQLMHELDIKDCHVVYSDTGWAADFWEERIKQGEKLASSYGFKTHRIQSEGMEALVRRKKGWPQGGAAAFCTGELKVKPAAKWLEDNDPEKESSCIIGIRREESRNRSGFPEHTEESEKHGGRELWAPMVRVKELERDDIIRRAGFEVLPHRSMECYPCAHANRSDLQMLDKNRISMIEEIENDMGYTRNNKLRTMFRPARHQGAIGIRQVINWANNTHEDQLDMFNCDGGWCGM